MSDDSAESKMSGAMNCFGIAAILALLGTIVGVVMLIQKVL